jgi:beta-glucanase (GH16 family)
MALTITATRRYTSTSGRASPYTDPDTPYFAQPVGLSGYGDPVFSDEFNGALTVTDAGLGYVTTRSGGPTYATWYPNWPRFNAQSPGGNHTNTDQAAYYATGKVAVTGGELVLACDQQTTVAGLPYTAGMLTTLPFYTPMYGYFEAKVKVSATAGGLWPAWWMSCSNFDTWPPEIDTWEHFDAADTYVSNVYIPGQSYVGSNRSATQTAYHVYGSLWTSGGVWFYRDGALIESTTTIVPSAPMYLILNNGARTPASPSFSSITMSVDYVRCWALP